jgi:hypothetical protein
MTTCQRISTALLLCVALLGGCVERKITIGSDPSGAIVLLNDQEIGRTPITVPFTWYGDYDIRLRYEKNVGTPENPTIVRYYLHTHKKTPIPWFEVVPMDFFAEILPFKFVDEHVWAFPIPEVQSIPDEELLRNAEELKNRLKDQPVVPR